MHHHHPLPVAAPPATTAPPPSSSAITTTTTSTHAHQRRRKKRPNYGTRTVEVRRGYNGFGFTISGQQPCRLSCIVGSSPADQAGLRAGDFLISVNGLNVSKLPHETVVQLIGNSFGSIRMQIAENYYSDSSDEENAALMAMQQQQQSGSGNGAVGGACSSALAGQLGLASGGARSAKPRYMHHKTKKIHRMRNSPQKKRGSAQRPEPAPAVGVNPLEASAPLRPLIEEQLPLGIHHCSGHGAAKSASSVSAPPLPLSMPPTQLANVSSDVANVSAMVRVPSAALEYRAIVGYLGTIEMPKQISHSSKLQTVRSCIRKLRQEKRQPTTVLMTILPECLRLQAAGGSLLASYASERLNYVSSSSESENRFFGLVTSAVHTSQADDEEEDYDHEARGGGGRDLAAKQEAHSSCSTGHISISNSCHVFVVDTRLCEHQAHVARALEFRIQCTNDPISSLCLEFPNNSEYVVNLIRSMYTMRILPPATRHTAPDDYPNGVPAMGGAPALGPGAAAHSPQPSNHSEISTTTSNSDSGIGFHNDCTNISDRILVVDFPAVPEVRLRPSLARPLGIFNNFEAIAAADKRLAVRAMPDPRTPPPPAAVVASSAVGRPNLLANFSLIKSPASSLTATRSCDDVLTLMERNADLGDLAAGGGGGDAVAQLLMPHASMDDIATLHTTSSGSTTAVSVSTTQHQHPPFPFLHPNCLGAVCKMAPTAGAGDVYSLLRETRSAVPNKLSAQVYVGLSTPPPAKTVPSTGARSRHSLGFPAIDSHPTRGAAVDGVGARSPLIKSQTDAETWRSLQDLYQSAKADDGVLDVTNSEPDLGTHALPANASPFRRAWGQSSFRTPRTDHHQLQPSPLVRRAASMTASDNDVYIKSIAGGSSSGAGAAASAAAGAPDSSYISELKQMHSSNQLRQQQQQQLQHPQQPAKLLPMDPPLKVPQIRMEPPTVVAAAAPAPVELTPAEPAGVVGWGKSFERLLDDVAGLQTFAEFLKKEFSAENIYFWTACERYRHLESAAERVAQARSIFSKHLGNGAMEPVNVDSHARNLTEEKLLNADADIFAHAQKQIFNLMKFDSYQRFIRSDLYKSCLEAEEKRLPLPFGGDDLDELLKTNFHQAAASKLKKSASNAEDRRRKSLLPWHRKTRSKSRDGSEEAGGKMPPPPPSKLPQLSGSSLKIPSVSSTQNSLSDPHSSRSSLSSFDAIPGGHLNASAAAEAAYSLCRVILSDGATTIVQTRPEETVGQLVERLLEKRGLSYAFYDVVANGSTKSIDLQSPAQLLAGKEVLIEQRVAFKLDLPDPKVISVKSKPKKQLHEVIRPILHKYNYSMDQVEVLMRGETRTRLDLSLPVTVADGQRLQIVYIQAPPPPPPSAACDDYQNCSGATAKFLRSTAALPKSVSFPSIPSKMTIMMGVPASRNGVGPMTQRSLDEITNKVFSDLLQGKVESQAASRRPADLSSLKSEDCASEASSSIFDRIRRRDSNTAASKYQKSKKKSSSSQHSEEASQCGSGSNGAPSVAMTASATTPLTTTTAADIKKPIIAKLKAGVKLQVTERVVENQDDLLEGLKRAQLARLEDQRGTEINFELPDFLKNKENLSAAATKLRKVRANLSPVNKTASPPSVATVEEAAASPVASPTAIERPQPAPRLSITNRQKAPSLSPMKIDEDPAAEEANTEADHLGYAVGGIGNGGGAKGPPPLPPKPKVLPIKPSNWGVATTSAASTPATTPTTLAPLSLSHSSSKIPIEIGRKASHLGAGEPATTRCAYLQEPSSSFV